MRVSRGARAPGSKVTLAPLTCAGPGDWNSGSIRTLPVKYSAVPRLAGWEPLRWMSMRVSSHRRMRRWRDIHAGTSAPAGLSGIKRMDP